MSEKTRARKLARKQQVSQVRRLGGDVAAAACNRAKNERRTRQRLAKSSCDQWTGDEEGLCPAANCIDANTPVWAVESWDASSWAASVGDVDADWAQAPNHSYDEVLSQVNTEADQWTGNQEGWRRLPKDMDANASSWIAESWTASSYVSSWTACWDDAETGLQQVPSHSDTDVPKWANSSSDQWAGGGEGLRLRTTCMEPTASDRAAEGWATSKWTASVDDVDLAWVQARSHTYGEVPSQHTGNDNHQFLMSFF